jgi:hypothetical protein
MKEKYKNKMPLSVQSFARWTLSVGMIACLAVADKDSDYYPPGMANNNVKSAMYWKDSINVLQDLDQFESLYIQYHGCVWSKYGSRYGSGEHSDGQQNENDGEEQGGEGNQAVYGNGCGGWGGEHFWYMGRTQCFKANVAYSLYGILKNDSRSLQGSPCQESKYINSFFTTYGVESFTGPLGLGTDDYNSQCTAVEPDDAGEVENYSNYQADDDYVDDSFYFYNWEAFTSYGIGCSADGAFVQDSYQGAFCKGRKFVETVDTLDDFNTQLGSMQCTQIYKSDEDQDYNGKDYTDDDSSFEFDEMDAIEILSFSKSCSLRQYPHDCPDPFGLKQKYAKSRIASTNIHKKAESMLNIGSYVCLAMGLVCWLAAFWVTRQGRRDRAEARQVHSIGMKKTTSSDSTAKDDENDDSDGNAPIGVKPDYGFEYVRTTSMHKKRKSQKKSGKSKKPKKPNPLPNSITLEPKCESKPFSKHRKTMSLPRFLTMKRDPATLLDIDHPEDENVMTTESRLA